MEVAENPMEVAAEAQGIAHDDPEDGGKAHSNEALHHDGYRVLLADEPSIEQC